jgi:hypothetical protein
MLRMLLALSTIVGKCVVVVVVDDAANVVVVVLCVVVADDVFNFRGVGEFVGDVKVINCSNITSVVVVVVEMSSSLSVSSILM